MGGIRELLDGKIWEWDLSFRREWEWDGNGNEVIEMGGNWYEKSVPAHHESQPREQYSASEVTTLWRYTNLFIIIIIIIIIIR